MGQDGLRGVAVQNGASTMDSYDFPLLNVFLSLLYFFLFVIYIWIAISVIIDIFRSRDLSGWAKAIWVFFLIVLMPITVLVYLVVRGGSMHERQVERAEASQMAFERYVREAAQVDTADQLGKLAALKESGHLTDDEFAAQKAKLLA